MTAPATPDSTVFSYFTRHAGEVIRERGAIDLEAATLLLKHFHWRDEASPDPAATPSPSLRGWLARMHRGAATASRHHAVRDPEAWGSLVGFVDGDGAELVVSRVEAMFYVDFAEPVSRRVLPGMHVRRWSLRGAATPEMEDVLSLAKLFFTGRKPVLDDLLRAAEHQPARQSA